MSGIMLNMDSNTFLWSRLELLDRINEGYLKSVMLQYEGTDVTDYVFNINDTLSAIPCKTKTSYADKYLRKEENGQPVDYSGTICKAAYHIWNVLGLDLYKIWIDAVRSININPWFSFRMNDRHAHHLYPTPHFLFSDFFYAHVEEYAHVHGRKTEFYIDRSRDYLIPEVRQDMYDYIAEMLQQYDLYGIELDFQREFNCFPAGYEEVGREVMLGFMQEVKKIVTKAEQQWGHTIKISMRCHPDPITCYELGFDVLEYAQQGLIDLFVAAPRFKSSDSNMPIGYWKKQLKPYGVEVAGGMESMVRSYPNTPARDCSEETFHSVESLMGIAAYVLTQGADKFYVYNVFDNHDQMMTPENRQESNHIYMTDGHNTNAKGAYTLLSNAGSMEKLRKRRRKCVLSYTDTCAIGGVVKAVLPAALTKTDSMPTYLKINTGSLSDTDKVYLRIGTADDVSSLEVYVNDRKAEYVGCEDVGFPQATKNKVYKYLVSNEAYSPCAQVSELIYRGEGKFVVDYADMIVEP